jgi:hypothetical protein
MKHLLFLVVSVLLLAACSSPKYTYNFDRYDYNSGRKKADAEKALATALPVSTDEASPLILNEESVVASADGATIAPAAAVKPVTKKYSDMSKTEKKELRKKRK